MASWAKFVVPRVEGGLGRCSYFGGRTTAQPVLLYLPVQRLARNIQLFSHAGDVAVKAFEHILDNLLFLRRNNRFDAVGEGFSGWLGSAGSDFFGN